MSWLVAWATWFNRSKTTRFKCRAIFLVNYKLSFSPRCRWSSLKLICSWCFNNLSAPPNSSHQTMTSWGWWVSSSRTYRPSRCKCHNLPTTLCLTICSHPHRVCSRNLSMLDLQGIHVLDHHPWQVRKLSRKLVLNKTLRTGRNNNYNSTRCLIKC